MPIRMEEDNDGDGYSGSQDSRGGTGGGYGGGGFPLWILINLFFRYPKFTIVLVLIGGIYYFAQKGCSGPTHSKHESSYNTGATLDEKVYDKNEVYAALDNGEPLPDKVSLEKFAPVVGDQGQQGSCVGWGSTYCGRTVLESVISGQNPDAVKFSPAFTYNQIGLDGCQGSYITDAVNLLSKVGAVPYNEFPYTENSCDKQPGENVKRDAAKHKMRGANRLTLNGDDYTVDINAIRQNLAHNAPVIIGMAVGGSFMHDMEGKDVWEPTRSDFNMNGFGGHCMCIIGYDDRYFKDDGAFLIQNSWGPKWGKNGRAWVAYRDLVHFTSEAYGIDPMSSQADQSKLECSLGIIDKVSKSDIKLVDKGNNVFATAAPLKMGQKFKMKITNNVDCYVYIFGKESDNGSYVLFPYTPKHSSYCGITGTRIFPRDYSMVPDTIGRKDYFAILISKNKLDFKALNEKLNSDKKTDFIQRVMDLCGDGKVENVKFSKSTGIEFKTEIKDKSIVPVIIEVNKN